jgi:hypothetical protein
MAGPSEAAASPEAVAQAVLAVVAGLGDPPIRELPGLDADSPSLELPSETEAVSIIANTSLLTGPVKLELLDRIRRLRGRDDEGVQRIAQSLVRPGASQGIRASAAEGLLSRIDDLQRPSGVDPLNRRAEDLLVHDEAISSLQEDVGSLALSFCLPDCESEKKKVGTRPALSIRTEAWTTQPVSDFTEFANPREWPHCPVQQSFFRAMEISPKYPGEDALATPDHGYRATLRETVDFSLGLGWAPMTTDLDVVYFNNPLRVGCTYDWRGSVDGKITIDQGYVLVEDCPGRGLRRIRTLKEVHFAAGDARSSLICPVWGPAAMLIQWACARSGPPAILTRVLAEVADCWAHAAAITERTLNGSYNAAQAFDDAMQYATRSSALGLAAFTGWMGLLRPMVTEPSGGRAGSRIAPPAGLADLRPGQFRAIGTGNQHCIAPSDVTIGLDPSDPGELAVDLSFENVSQFERERTIVYEGNVHDAAGAPVGDAFRVAKPAE